jgi:hypothetical protein
VERLPFALHYVTNLQPRDHAVLFYDNLVAAAEYFCAFIEEGIRRQEVTCITGLEPRKYRALFEQVGIRVEELENGGYLRHLSASEFYDGPEQPIWNHSGGHIDAPLRCDLFPGRNRFIHIHGPRCQRDDMSQEIMENERRYHRSDALPMISICCYDAKLVLEDAPTDVFTELLKGHNHCFFQGIAMQTSMLIGGQRDTVYPKVRSP